jgi:CRISPR-associated protein (TIGR02710 family)
MTTLICTVGGSHEPIVHVIQALQPDFVCFVCSSDDVATGQKGSYQQIIGKGSIIKANRKDDKPSLPNIPAQTGLKSAQFEILEVQPDDFDDIYAQLSDWFAGRDHEKEHLVADYTGGTKTMSAALVAAALDADGVELRLVTGNRADLVKVVSGSESSAPASVEATRMQRRMNEAVAMWDHFAYAEAAIALYKIPMPRNAGRRSQLQRARDLSEAFAAWDRFDHATAEKILTRYKPLLGKSLGEMFGVLGFLNKQLPEREPLQLFDLYRNAQRRAAGQRYDDAIARLYRLLEWSAQWLLREFAGIETSDVPEEKIPSHIKLTKDQSERYQAGLRNAWELAALYCGDDIQQFWQAEQQTMLHHLKARNHSILAHGFEPLSEQEWHDFHAWIEAKLLPLLLGIITTNKKIRIRQLTQQLPDRYPQV